MQSGPCSGCCPQVSPRFPPLPLPPACTTGSRNVVAEQPPACQRRSSGRSRPAPAGGAASRTDTTWATTGMFAHHSCSGCFRRPPSRRPAAPQPSPAAATAAGKPPPALLRTAAGPQLPAPRRLKVELSAVRSHGCNLVVAQPPKHQLVLQVAVGVGIKCWQLEAEASHCRHLGPAPPTCCPAGAQAALQTAGLSSRMPPSLLTGRQKEATRFIPSRCSVCITRSGDSRTRSCRHSEGWIRVQLGWTTGRLRVGAVWRVSSGGRAG